MDYSIFNKEYIQTLIYESTSISEVLKKLGQKSNGFYHTEFTKFLKDNNFDTSKIAGRTINKLRGKKASRLPLSEILVENGSGNSNSLKKRLVREGVKEYKCEKCGVSEWNGEFLALQLHHINGNHFDNRLFNLLLLCPNCHSQTDNFCKKEFSKEDIDASNQKMEEIKKSEQKRREEIFRNRIKYGAKKREPRVPKYCEMCGKEINRNNKRFCSLDCAHKYELKQLGRNYDKDTLLKQSLEVHSLRALGRLYGVTDAAIKKHLKQLGIFEVVKENFSKR